MVAAYCRVGLLSVLFALPAAGCTHSAAPSVNDNNLRAHSAMVTYLDCVVYAGATHFYFRQRNGEEILLVESNDVDAIKTGNTALLLDPSPLEGPPGPNPALVGGQVTLHYDEQNNIVGVSVPED